MVRGTTPTHIFTIPISVEDVKKVRVIYAQNDTKLFCKETEDCVLKENTVSVKLTQEETLLFDCKNCVEIQLRVLTNDDVALASFPMQVGVSRCLEDEVIE